MRIIAVAERVHDPTLDAGRVDDWARAWRRGRVSAILNTPAMRRGDIRTRMQTMMGLTPDRVVNLLWPDNKIGTWDTREARLSAHELWGWVVGDAKYEIHPHRRVAGLVLLGARVRDAFMPVLRHQIQVEWGDIRTDDSVPAVLWLPHPSGRNRVLNDPAQREYLRARVALHRRVCEERSRCGSESTAG